MSASTSMPRLPILATKLTIPPHRPDIVSRRRLTDRLAPGLSGKLTLISAPPGSGKTTLVTEWLNSPAAAPNVAWLGLDPGDNDPGRFLTYFVSAIRTVQPDFGPGLIGLLQTAMSSDPAIALVDLINALDVLPGQVVVVLDDYHVIDNDDVHQVVGYILDHQPPTLHIMMTSRDTPPLPLALLRTRRQVVEFRRDDLRFTVDEATEFLNGVMGLQLSPAQVEALDARTEGWIAGLLLAALSARESPQPGAMLDAFGGEHRYVFDYLAAEVLEQQPEAVQRFLEATSILERMSAPLVEALTGDGQEMLDYLVGANLFTLPLDNERVWYRYHHLFSDFLQARLRERDPDGWRDAHRAAGQWFYDNGHRFEATQHAYAGNDPERLAELIEEIGPLLVRRGRISTITRWLEALPAEFVLQRPLLVIQCAWAAMFRRHFEQAGFWLERIDLSGVDDPDELLALRSEEAVCRATYSRFRGNLDDTIRLSSEALDLLESGLGLDHPDAGVAMLHLGSSLRIRGDTATSVGHLRGALELSQGGVDLIVELNAMSQLSTALWELGRYEEAERQAREALAREDENSLLRLAMAGAARTALADMLYARGEHDEARQHSKIAFDVIVASGDGEDLIAQMWALHTRALADVARGDARAAREAMDEAIERSIRHHLSEPFHWRIEGLRAHIDLLSGDLARAERWHPTAHLETPVGRPYLDERAAIAAAWLLLETGRCGEAEAVLEPLLAALDGAGRVPRYYEAALMLAAAREVDGRRAEALDLTLGAARWALERRAWRLLVDTHPAVHGLLPGVRARLEAEGYEWPDRLDQWIEVSDAPPAPDQSSLIEPLTERELEVLALLGAGATNRDIADQLFVSVGTVKRHTHNIYGKLDVNNRTQAILRGQELGLLDSA